MGPKRISSIHRVPVTIHVQIASLSGRRDPGSSLRLPSGHKHRIDICIYIHTYIYIYIHHIYIYISTQNRVDAGFSIFGFTLCFFFSYQAGVVQYPVSTAHTTVLDAGYDRFISCSVTLPPQGTRALYCVGCLRVVVLDGLCLNGPG